jgi:A/G-specific adenine glycosylase
MRRCSASERWAGLWDFLRFDTTNCRTQEALRKRIAELFQARFGCGIHLGEQVHQLKHAVTRYRITLNCFEAELDESQGEFSAPEIETLWVSPLQMTGLALNSSAKRLWNWLQKQQET